MPRQWTTAAAAAPLSSISANAQPPHQPHQQPQQKMARRRQVKHAPSRPFQSHRCRHRLCGARLMSHRRIADARWDRGRCANRPARSRASRLGSYLSYTPGRSSTRRARPGQARRSVQSARRRRLRTWPRRRCSRRTAPPSTAATWAAAPWTAASWMAARVLLPLPRRRQSCRFVRGVGPPVAAELARRSSRPASRRLRASRAVSSSQQYCVACPVELHPRIKSLRRCRSRRRSSCCSSRRSSRRRRRRSHNHSHSHKQRRRRPLLRHPHALPLESTPKFSRRRWSTCRRNAQRHPLWLCLLPVAATPTAVRCSPPSTQALHRISSTCCISCTDSPSAAPAQG